MRPLLPVLLVLGAACSSSPVSPPDTGSSDRPRPDQVVASEARPAEARIDLRPDGPRPPAVWQSIPSAPELQYHAMAPLPGGDLLVVGGTDYTTGAYVALDKAYRYSVTSNAFGDAGKLAVARFYHSATALVDGRVLVAGGETGPGPRLTSAELFDPSKPAASAWSTTAPMLTAATMHAALRLPSGLVVITGGRDNNGDSNSTVQLYDPASNTWKVTADPLKEGRRCHTMTLLKNGKVLIAGGIQGSSWGTVYLPSLEIYDPTNGTTKLLASTMHMGRCGHTASLLLDGRVLIAGGHCGDKACPKTFVDDLYDPAIDQVSPVVHPGDFPSAHVAATLLDGRVLVASGGKTLDVAVVFDPVQAAWSSAPPMQQGRWNAVAGRLPDGSVLVVGGLVSDAPYLRANTAERFFP